MERKGEKKWEALGCNRQRKRGREKISRLEGPSERGKEWLKRLKKWVVW